MRPRYIHVGTDTEGREHYYYTSPETDPEYSRPSVDSQQDQLIGLSPQLPLREAVIVIEPEGKTITHHIPLGDKTIHQYVSFVEDEDCGWSNKTFQRHDVDTFEKIGEVFAKALIAQERYHRKKNASTVEGV
jgi:hypothetical protein